jgi:hypothetical protein
MEGEGGYFGYFCLCCEGTELFVNSCIWMRWIDPNLTCGKRLEYVVLYRASCSWWFTSCTWVVQSDNSIYIRNTHCYSPLILWVYIAHWVTKSCMVARNIFSIIITVPPHTYIHTRGSQKVRFPMLLHGVLLLHFSPPNEVISAAYQATLKTLKRAVQCKRPQMSHKRVLLLHECPTAYSSCNSESFGTMELGNSWAPTLQPGSGTFEVSSLPQHEKTSSCQVIQITWCQAWGANMAARSG